MSGRPTGYTLLYDIKGAALIKGVPPAGGAYIEKRGWRTEYVPDIWAIAFEYDGPIPWGACCSDVFDEFGNLVGSLEVELKQHHA